MKQLLFAPLLFLASFHTEKKDAAPTTFGGDHYQVFINDRLIGEGHGENSTAAFALTHDNENDQLRVKYRHCGEKGKERKLVLMDGDKTIRSWEFRDRENGAATIGVAVKEILATKTSSHVAAVYYFSKELPKGRRMISLKMPS